MSTGLGTCYPSVAIVIVQIERMAVRTDEEERMLYSEVLPRNGLISGRNLLWRRDLTRVRVWAMCTHVRDMLSC